MIIITRTLGNVFDEHTFTENISDTIVSFLVAIGFGLLWLCAHLLTGKYLGIYQYSGLKNLVKFAVQKKLQLDNFFFIKNPAVDTWTKTNMSTQMVSSFFEGLVSSFIGLISFLVYAYIVFLISPVAGLITLLTVPIFMFSTLWAGKFSLLYQSGIMSGMQRLSVLAIEFITSILNIKVKNRQTFFTGKMFEVYDGIISNFKKNKILEHYFHGIQNILNIFIPLIVIITTVLISEHMMSVSQLLLLYINIPLLLRAFNSLYSAVLDFFRNRVAINNLIEFYSLPEEKHGSIAIATFESLTTRNISVNFDTGDTVSIPDVCLKKGEKVLLSGPSGSGKSTFFSILIGAIKDYEGEVFINDHNLKEIYMPSVWSMFGITFQSGNLFSLSLEDNVMGGTSLTNFDDVIDICKLTDLYMAKKETSLNKNIVSGGELSRISLAQTISNHFEVLLLDETFSGIDESTESEIMDKVISAHENKTIICISHRDSINKYFDKIINF